MSHKAQFKNLKFADKKSFEDWLVLKTKYKVYFADNDFDPNYWCVDKYGEVLHSDWQAPVWNGKVISVSELKKGKVVFTDGNWLRHNPIKVDILK